MKKRILHLIGVLGVAVGIGLPALVSAQTAEIPSHKQSYVWKSASHNGQKGNEAKKFLAERKSVDIPGALWLRLYFGDAKLGANSNITIISLKDGARQDLNTVTLAQWQNTSAYFNGDAVEVQIHAGPNDENTFLHLKELEVGEVPAAPESQCGPVDDRAPSNHPASGRLLNIGCTGWIIANGKQVTAGHCSGASATVLQFNVPLSNPNGSLNHPGPQDQYSVDAGSKVFVNGGIGNDWGVFSVFNNSQTGLQPIQAQGASFTVVQNLGPSTIRITGFGVDNNDPTRNQTQQTHAGPNAGSSVTTMRYQTDTEGGNSGSPVIDNATGNAVGVHTHGGCTTGGTGNNSGTSTFNSAFWTALGGGGGCSNIALGDPTLASSTNGGNTSNLAVDGNAGTFWQSASGGTQYLRVNLGAGASYSQVTIKWQGSLHATKFKIRVSNNANFNNFSNVFSTNSGAGGNQTINLSGAPRTERYILLYMTIANGSAYAVNEFEVCGSSASATAKQNAEANETAIIPAEFTLEQNYPNPFGSAATSPASGGGNPSTNISFGLPEDAHVTLKVYNLVGAEVATLVNERREAGLHTAVFDASHLPSGVYFSVLKAGETKLIRRLVLMK